jgi:nucleoside-diphosphate-sugar epimerase
MTNPGRSVAVTGAGGFIGTRVCAALAATGAAVTGVDRDPEAAARVEAAGARFAVADVTDPTLLTSVLQGHGGVVHTAALVAEGGSMEASIEVNVRGTRNVLDAAEAVGADRIVHVSSVAVWGYEFGDRLDEDAPTRRSGNPYIDTKAASDELARRRGATVVRPGDVYGPGSVQWSVRPVQLLRSGRMMLPDGGRGLLTPIYIDDLVDCVVRALRHPDAGGQTFVAWDGEAVTAREFFGHYARMVGRAKIPSVPAPVLRAGVRVQSVLERLAGRPASLEPDAAIFLSRRATYPNDRAREVLGWEPQVDLAEGMRRTEAWLRAEGLLSSA